MSLAAVWGEGDEDGECERARESTDLSCQLAVLPYPAPTAACYDLFMSAADKRLDLDELAQSAAEGCAASSNPHPNPNLNLKLKISIREVN